MRLALASVQTLSTNMACAGFHTILLTSEGRAEAFGHEQFGQCAVPELPEGVRYVACAAGGHHTVLLTSEGRAEAFGSPSRSYGATSPRGVGLGSYL